MDLQPPHATDTKLSFLLSRAYSNCSSCLIKVVGWRNFSKSLKEKEALLDQTLNPRRNTRKRCEICSKLTIKTPARGH